VKEHIRKIRADGHGPIGHSLGLIGQHVSALEMEIPKGSR
jgi:hypothetical protein